MVLPEVKVFMAPWVETAYRESEPAVRDPQRASKGTPTSVPPRPRRGLRMEKACREGRGTGEREDKDRSGGDLTSKLLAEKWTREGSGEGVCQKGEGMDKERPGENEGGNGSDGPVLPRSHKG